MEVIHRFNGFYPFSLEVQSQQTYLQVLKEDLTQQQIGTFRKRYKILKTIDQTNFIKLVRVYKEQSKLHLLYEYFPLSLDKYVQYRSQNCKEADRDQYKLIYGQFVGVISSIIDIFIKFQIKTDIIIQNFVITDVQKAHIKLFVDPDAEYIGLDLQNQNNQQQIRANKAFLQEFYLAEKKRVVMQLEEILQKYFGKNNVGAEPNKPNFIINGSKLVFINNQEQRNCEKQRKCQRFNDTIQQNQGIKGENKRPIHSNSPVKTQKSQMKRDLKEKTLKKLTEIKSVLNRFQAITPHISNQDEYKYYPEAQDEIIFRPEEITNDKTALLEENQYLQSLENEIEKINEAKKIKEERQSEEKRAQIIKQISQIQQKNKKFSELSSKGLKYNTNLEKNCKNDSNSTKNDTRNNDKSGNSINSEQVGSKAEERKEEKPNRYKMKIITSHEIQIEGTGEPQVRAVEKDIIEGIKSGKINISEASQKPQRPKTVKLDTEQSNHFQEKKFRSTMEDNLRLNSRNSDIASKSKKINEIIQKINSKSNINGQLSNSSHNPDQKAEKTENLSSFKANIEPVEQPQENYFDKIRQAKSKAQQVLKQYAKKKQ